MELTIAIVVVLAVGYGLVWLLRSRAKKNAERLARTEKRTKSAQAEARAIQRTLDGRR